MDFFFALAAMLNKHVAAPSANSASFPCQMHFVSAREPRESKSVPFPLLGMTRNLQFRLRGGGCLRLSNKSWCSSTSKLGSGNVSYSPQSAFGSGAMKPRTWGLHCTGDTTWFPMGKKWRRSRDCRPPTAAKGAKIWWIWCEMLDENMTYWGEKALFFLKETPLLIAACAKVDMEYMELASGWVYRNPSVCILTKFQFGMFQHVPTRNGRIQVLETWQKMAQKMAKVCFRWTEKTSFLLNSKPGSHFHDRRHQPMRRVSLRPLRPRPLSPKCAPGTSMPRTASAFTKRQMGSP